MPKEKLFTRFALNLGGIVISLKAADRRAAFIVDPQRQYFSCAQEPDIRLRVHRRDILPSHEQEEAVFDSKGLWSLSRSRDRYILYGKSDAEKPPDRQAVFSSDLRFGDIYMKPPEDLQSAFRYPLRFPLDEILTIILLSLKGGALVHACAVADGRRGILFVGDSGAGKSTMARLYGKRKDVAILSDDRVIVRQKKGSFYLYGTPWHGDEDVCSSHKAPLRRVFFLKHDNTNNLKKMALPEAASRLLVSSFAPFWAKDRMEVALSFCAQLAQKVPCHELGFLPDASVLDFIEENL